MTKQCNHQPEDIHFDHTKEATVCDSCGEVLEQYVSLGDVVGFIDNFEILDEHERVLLVELTEEIINKFKNTN